MQHTTSIQGNRENDKQKAGLLCLMQGINLILFCFVLFDYLALTRGLWPVRVPGGCCVRSYTSVTARQDRRAARFRDSSLTPRTPTVLIQTPCFLLCWLHFQEPYTHAQLTLSLSCSLVNHRCLPPSPSLVAFNRSSSSGVLVRSVDPSEESSHKPPATLPAQRSTTKPDTKMLAVVLFLLAGLVASTPRSPLGFLGSCGPIVVRYV